MKHSRKLLALLLCLALALGSFALSEVAPELPEEGAAEAFEPEPAEPAPEEAAQAEPEADSAAPEGAESVPEPDEAPSASDASPEPGPSEPGFGEQGAPEFEITPPHPMISRR